MQRDETRSNHVETPCLQACLDSANKRVRATPCRSTNRTLGKIAGDLGLYACRMT